ncbi:hypothetical protein Gotur_003143, partial [Gossypium turneri]
ELHEKPYHNRIITLLRDFHPLILQPILEPIPSWPRSHQCILIQCIREHRVLITDNVGIYGGSDLRQHGRSGEIKER